ncbi:Efflux pump antibiotic resistance protein [Rasamsonia emersonii CBS 393.64]|uniref:Efflux pump antibiotic resistance protein n=1 Tax=Rasamsonia emersonii (strain ATCC 16479 / CBS 393.64 / IMI 116815) TaxID=1408163 RepID=A0A0F4Z389_RASE3|nr:Efflux pump antibiotic resistance protein [Rasamsonia emersonii CBS 393.64]KKA24338.1 Efflux pump antibiotic resistance protein [Rasamsonia emersonii CBS 393.64]
MAEDKEQPVKISTENQTDQPTAHDSEYPGIWSLVAIMVALYLAIFLVALDRTIIATAIPRITDTFHALDDIGWYGSSYLLTSCSFQLLYGRFYTFYSPKWVLLSAIALFEIGSAVCGAAPNSTSFIIGRAIAGLGSCGIFSGAIVVTASSVPLQKRPMLTGFMGAIFGVASVVAPLMGGAFTDRVSWRWCFYINLPIGAVAVLIIVLILKASPPPNPSAASTTRERLAQLDPLGTLCFLPGIACLLLALQWGGSKYAWDNARIIVLFVLFGVLMILFVAIQIWKQDTATVPPRIIKQRSVAFGFCFTICVAGSMMLFVYYLPIWFQAIKGVSAVKSGIMNIPVVLSLVLGSIIAGVSVSRMGYYVPFMYASTVIMSIGAGLLTTFTTTTDHQKWIGYQVVYGFGLGLGMQQASVAAQTVLEKKDIPTGAALMMLAQSLGGSIFLSIGETVFTNGLIAHLQEALHGQNGDDFAHLVANTGATDLRNAIDPKFLPLVLKAYNAAVTKTFTVALCLCCISLLGVLGVEWKNVKGEKQEKGAAV